MGFHPPFSRPEPKGRASVPLPATGADPSGEDDLPPIERFLDELPSIDDYVTRREAGEGVSQLRSEEVWWNAGPQSYDWNAAAGLGRRQEMSGATELGEGTLPGEGLGAQEVARALDHLAERIRSGEIPIDRLQGMRPEAVIAAALAAMIRRPPG